MKLDYQNALLLVLCLVLLLSVFSLTASAVEIDPLIIGNTATVVVSYYTPSTEFDLSYKRFDGAQEIYVVRYGDMYDGFVGNGSESFGFLLFADSYFRFTWRGNSSSTNTGTLNSVYDETNDIYYYDDGIKIRTGTSPDVLDSIPYFTTLSDALSFAVSYLNGSTTPLNGLQYSLPPGNAIYIQVPQGASYTLKTRMPESVLGTNHYPGNNQAITLVQSLPTGGTAPSSPLIPWQQDGALSVLGLSRNASYQGTNASAGYLCIVNPLYYSGTANGPYEFLSNGSIDISIDQQSGFVVYPLDSTLGFTSGLGINVDTTILDNPYTGGIDPDTGEIIWQDSNGGSTAPTTGGGNLVSTSETIFDFLRNIGDEIATFLKGPIQAIQVVVSAIREFLGSFTQLYMWLPSPVYNLITSALMIALTIGVIKIFV